MGVDECEFFELIIGNERVSRVLDVLGALKPDAAGISKLLQELKQLRAMVESRRAYAEEVGAMLVASALLSAQSARI